ncbi:hypothetical protein J9B83_02990 [Marinomonas sp. A79]|uniref:Uncharacterized protein n=1 Tax=Marinomonas vulgaris TaxID=2823372 RepID=A0ABS5H8T9_9GAMM|nr:hypothetical protein [Marinomonas vulgaris]MBR7887895.1 hypothetical protein [Marinomonas vulgaris]
MDSQEQYEALLAKWGYTDNSAKIQRRRQARAKIVKASLVFLTSIIKRAKKLTHSPAQAGQLSH